VNEPCGNLSKIGKFGLTQPEASAAGTDGGTQSVLATCTYLHVGTVNRQAERSLG